MRHYWKFLWVAVACGILCMLNIAASVESIPAIDIVKLFGMEQVSYFIGYITEITFWMAPLLLFQIVFGTYIYQNFCAVSVYYFSRYPKRTKWFYIEAGKLYLFVVLYLLILLGTGFATCAGITDVIWDANTWELLIFYMAVYSLYLFSATLGINLVAIASNSTTGFVVVEGITFSLIAAYTIVGDFFAQEGVILPEYEWTIRINPFYYLVFGMHETPTDYMQAIGLYGVLAAIVLAIGYFVINKHDFIEVNKEIGGI